MYEQTMVSHNLPALCLKLNLWLEANVLLAHTPCFAAGASHM